MTFFHKETPHAMGEVYCAWLLSDNTLPLAAGTEGSESRAERTVPLSLLVH